MTRAELIEAIYKRLGARGLPSSGPNVTAVIDALNEIYQECHGGQVTDLFGDDPPRELEGTHE